MKEISRFSPDVCKQLGLYIYRLVDPRTDKTFYVGKGEENRIFSHVNQSLKSEDRDDRETAKSKRIRDIQDAGFEVKLVVHRHGLKNDYTAFQIEAALIDMLNEMGVELTNEVRGKGVKFGPSTVQELENVYAAEPMKLGDNHRLIFIILKDKTLHENNYNVYDAVKGHWVISRARAEKVDYVLAMNRGICIGIFEPTSWYPSQQLNEEKRLGFRGAEIESGEVYERYFNKRFPAGFRKEGARNPIAHHPKKP